MVWAMCWNEGNWGKCGGNKGATWERAFEEGLYQLQLYISAREPTHKQGHFGFETFGTLFEIWNVFSFCSGRPEHPTRALLKGGYAVLLC